MSTDNPYAAPQFAVEPALEYAHFPLASQGQRFVNLIVDSIVTQVIAFGFGIAIAIAFVADEGPDANAESVGLELFSQLFGFGITLAYYLVMEAACGRTIGKLHAIDVVAAGTHAAKKDRLHRAE